MTLFDPSVSVFVGDDKFTGNAYAPSSQSNTRPGVSHYEVPVHVVLPFEMCDALYREKESKFLENLQLRLGNDVYTLSGKDILDAKVSRKETITLKDHQHVNMLDSSRPPVYNDLEVDLSYVVDAVSHAIPQGDIKVPLVVRVPSERPTDLNKIAVFSARDLTHEGTMRTDVESTHRADPVMPHSQYTPREGVDQTVPDLFSDPNESVQVRARAILTRGAIPDDISGIDHYRPPAGVTHESRRKGSALTGNRMSVRSYNSNASVVSKYTSHPPNKYSGRYGASTSSVLNSEGRVRTRRTNYSEPIYTSQHPHPRQAGQTFPPHPQQYQQSSVPQLSHRLAEDRPPQWRQYRAPHERRVDKAKTITFFRNGDAQFPGYTTSVSHREFRSWETLLVFLSDKISLPYGVRYVYTLGGQLVQGIEEMDDGQAYVCASGQFVHNVQFGNSHELHWKRNRKSSGGKVRRADKKLFEEEGLDESPRRATSQTVYRRGSSSNKVADGNPLVITVISNTHRESKAKEVVNPRTNQSFAEFLEDLSLNIVMPSPPARKLYTAKTGERVTSFNDFFGKFRFHDTYIACGLENFKGVLNGNQIRLPPTISEASDEISGSHQQGVSSASGNKNGVSRRNTRHRRPLRTLQQMENSMLTEESVSALHLNGNRHNERSPEFKLKELRVGGGGGVVGGGREGLILDGEAERRKLFNDDMLIEEREDEQEQGMRLRLDPTSQSFHNSMHNGNNQRINQQDTISVQIHGKTRDFFLPSDNVGDDLESAVGKPSRKLALEWVYGYRGYDSRMNLYCVGGKGSEELCYYVGAVAVLYDRNVDIQRHYTGHTEDISSMAVHPSGTLIATGQKKGSEKANWGHVRVWDTDSLSTHAILGLSHFEGSVCVLSFSSVNSGEWLMSVDSADNHVMTVWDWQQETIVAKTKTSADTVVCGSFHPNDDRQLVSGGKQHLYFWRIINGRILRDKKSGAFIDEIPHYVTCLTFNLEGEVISGDSSGNIIVWGRDARNVYFVKNTILRAHEKSVFSLCHLQDGTLLSGGGLDRRIIAWDGTQSYTSAKAGRQLPDAVGGVRMLATTASGGVDGQLFVGTTKNVILQGSLQQKFTSIVQGHFEEIWALATHPSEEFFVTAGFDQQICMWNCSTHKLQWKVFTEKPCMTCVFHPSGTVVGVGQSSGRFVVLNAYSGIHVTSFHVTTEQIDVARISPDGSQLAIGCHDKNIYIFDVQDNGLSYRRTGVMSGHNSFIMQIDWSDDSRYLQSVSGNYNLLFWDVDKLRGESDKKTRDVHWHTHSSVLGFHVAGIWPSVPKATNVNICAVSQTTSSPVVAAGDSRGHIRLFQYPASHNKCFFSEQKVCSNNVTQLEFMQTDNCMIATAGPDACLFQYHLIDA